MNQTLRNIKSNIRRLMVEKQLSYRRLAALAGLHFTQLHEIVGGDYDIKIVTLTKIADGLGVEIGDLMKGENQ